jgi:hypothetical protein
MLTGFRQCALVPWVRRWQDLIDAVRRYGKYGAVDPLPFTPLVVFDWQS